MADIIPVAFHASQFPDNVRRDLIESLRARKVNHKFHYDSVKQTQKWLALHEAWSPARRDPGCLEIYQQSFRDTAARVRSRKVQVVGLGCGGGQKDSQLLQFLQESGIGATYVPCDVSSAMVLVAHQAVAGLIQDCLIRPLVCDLATVHDMKGLLDAHVVCDVPRVITFFGMIPNFEPEKILPKLSAALRPEDWLLFSANLAPGRDYMEGMRRILPQYDNQLTRDWLMTFLLDLGIEREDGELRFSIEPCASGADLLRVVARFAFSQSRTLTAAGESFVFAPGESITLFFSYRYTPDRVAAVTRTHGMRLLNQWISDSGEEGVFLFQRDTP